MQSQESKKAPITLATNPVVRMQLSALQDLRTFIHADGGFNLSNLRRHQGNVMSVDTSTKHTDKAVSTLAVELLRKTPAFSLIEQNVDGLMRGAFSIPASDPVKEIAIPVVRFGKASDEMRLEFVAVSCDPVVLLPKRDRIASLAPNHGFRVDRQEEAKLPTGQFDGRIYLIDNRTDVGLCIVPQFT